MTRRACSRELLHAALAAGLLACVASQATADQAIYCVTCKDPDQTYRCQVTSDAMPSDALKLYCVIRTAKEGNHASCAAERSTGPCNGIVKVYRYDGPAIPEEIASDPRVQRFVNHAAREQQSSQQPKDNAPKTVAELTSRAISASRRGLRNARSVFVGSSQAADQQPAASAAPLPLTPHTAAPPPPAEADATTGSVAPAKSAAGPVKRAALNASAAVGGFARRSYRCVMSLFRHCGSGADGSQALQ
jgi:hypothetical protein